MSELGVVLTDIVNRSNAEAPVIQDLTSRVFGLRSATNIPGGFSACSFSLLLPQNRAYEWYERFLFYGILIHEADSPVWEGRISSIGIKEYGIDVVCEGYWASLADQTMYSWWSDNDLSKWLIPTPGSGGVSDEITLSGVGNINRFDVQSSDAQLYFASRVGVTYTTGDKAVVYYRLPRVSNLSDKRVFQPNTIHAIRYTWGASNLDVGEVRPKVWAADYPRGSWNERDIPSYQGMIGVNLEADSTAIEAVAIGIDTIIGGPETLVRSVAFTDVTIYAERDAFFDQTKKPTFKNIAVSLLEGQSRVNTDAHAKQVKADFLSVEESDLEYIPLVSENRTLQEMFTQLIGYGFGTIENIIPNPSAEDNLNGWWGTPGATPTQVADAQFGTQGVQVVTPIAGVGVCLLNLIGTGHIGTLVLKNVHYFSVLPNTDYTFSVYVKRVSGNTAMVFEIQWYNASEGWVSDHDQPFTMTDSYVRYSISLTTPPTAYAAFLKVLNNSGGAITFVCDGAQFEKGSSATTYKDPSQRDDLFWGGTPSASPTMSVLPGMIGVFGRNRLQARRRDESNIKWLLSVKDIDEGGIELQKSIEGYYPRVWARFEKFLTGETGFTDSIKDTISEQLLYDQRDIILNLGRSLEGFARLAAQAHLEDHRLPTQSSQLTITGTITNILGAREPLWRVRAGDLLYIYDLAPLPLLRTNEITGKVLDRLRIFVIKETSYDASSGELAIVPDAPPDRLDLIMARLETTQAGAGKVMPFPALVSPAE